MGAKRLLTISKKKRSGLSAQEAYNIWDFLTSKYLVLTRLAIWENFVHDMDLSMILAGALLAHEGLGRGISPLS